MYESIINIIIIIIILRGRRAQDERAVLHASGKINLGGARSLAPPQVRAPGPSCLRGRRTGAGFLGWGPCV